MTPSHNIDDSEAERNQLLQEIHEFAETPLTILSIIWILLVVLEMVYGISHFLQIVVLCIWAVFILDFGLELLLASNRKRYIRDNILSIASLLIPAFRSLRLLRVFRIFRLVRFSRAGVLLRLISATNRTMRLLAAVFAERGFGYVLSTTIIVLFAGAGGMLYFENPSALSAYNPAEESTGLRDYGESLWWTAMLLTTIGSEYWPKTAEGKILCWFLAIYAFSFFGYITATLATFFIGKNLRHGSSRERT